MELSIKVKKFCFFNSSNGSRAQQGILSGAMMINQSFLAKMILSTSHYKNRVIRVYHAGEKIYESAEGEIRPNPTLSDTQPTNDAEHGTVHQILISEVPSYPTGDEEIFLTIKVFGESDQLLQQLDLRADVLTL